MKIEFEIPEFKSELKIEITIRRDGEVVYSTSSSADEFPVDNKVDNKTTRKAKSLAPSSSTSATERTTAEGKGGGNMMNMSEF